MQDFKTLNFCNDTSLLWFISYIWNVAGKEVPLEKLPVMSLANGRCNNNKQMVNCH